MMPTLSRAHNKPQIHTKDKTHMLIDQLLISEEITVLDAMNQLEKTEKGINKIILLKNTVNIRYVNNKNLLDYLYLKYDN